MTFCDKLEPIHRADYSYSKNSMSDYPNIPILARAIGLKDFYYSPDIPLKLCYNIGSTAKLLTSGALSQPIGEAN